MEKNHCCLLNVITAICLDLPPPFCLGIAILIFAFVAFSRSFFLGADLVEQLCFSFALFLTVLVTFQTLFCPNVFFAGLGPTTNLFCCSVIGPHLRVLTNKLTHAYCRSGCVRAHYSLSRVLTWVTCSARPRHTPSPGARAKSSTTTTLVSQRSGWTSGRNSTTKSTQVRAG